jgi:cobalamin biosynthesis protein CbiD
MLTDDSKNIVPNAAPAKVFIKLRKKGEKKFRFLTPEYNETTLRIRAAMVDANRAEGIVAKLAADNPDFEFVIRSMQRRNPWRATLSV